MTDKKGKSCWEVLKDYAVKTGDLKLLTLMANVEKLVGKYYK